MSCGTDRTTGRRFEHGNVQALNLHHPAAAVPHDAEQRTFAPGSRPATLDGVAASAHAPLCPLCPLLAVLAARWLTKQRVAVAQQLLP